MSFVLKPLFFQFIALCIGAAVSYALLLSPLYPLIAQGIGLPASGGKGVLLAWALFAAFFPILFVLGAFLDFIFLVLTYKSRLAFSLVMTLAGAAVFVAAGPLIRHLLGTTLGTTLGPTLWPTTESLAYFWPASAVAALTQALTYWPLRDLGGAIEKIRQDDAASRNASAP